MRKLTILTALAFVIAVCALPALADQLTLAVSNSDVYFCAPSGGGNIYVSATSFATPSNCSGNSGGTVGGTALYQSVNPANDFNGTYEIGFPVPSLQLLYPPNGFGQFSTNGVTSSFSFNGTGSGAGNDMSGTITWTLVKDDTPDPQFNGAVSISSSTGGTAFLAAFPANHTVALDFTMNAITPLGGAGNLGATGGTTADTIESGSVPGVPEVSSILLLGTGLLSAGTFVRLRRRRQS